MRVPLSRPWLGEAEARAVAEVLESGWVTQGTRVERLEQIVRERMGLPYAAATSSCSAALYLALRIVGVGPGDEVLVPSFTFPAPVNAVLLAGGAPVFVDVDPRTYNLDPEDLARRVTRRARVVLAVHQFGLSCDMERIADVAAGHGLEIIEDAACSLGSLHRGAPAGRHGRAATLSFHPRKVVTTGEGGMLLTREREAWERAVSLRSQGAGASDMARHRSGTLLLPSFADHGFNFRMSDLAAAVGCAQMERLDEILAGRRRVARRYVEAISGMRGVAAPFVPAGDEPNFQTFCCVLDAGTPLSRDALVEALRARGVGSTFGSVACHLEPAYRAHVRGALPVTERLHRRSFLLPLYSQMEDAEVDHVLSTLAELLRS